MSGCAYCERPGSVMACDECDALCCVVHRVSICIDGYDAILCNPDPATWPGRGCYKRPVNEVANG